jgi:hypothetical protein
MVINETLWSVKMQTETKARPAVIIEEKRNNRKWLFENEVGGFREERICRESSTEISASMPIIL